MCVGLCVFMRTSTVLHAHQLAHVTTSSGGSINTFPLHSSMIKWDVQGWIPDILPNLRMSSWRSAMSSCVQASASGAITCRSKHLQTRSTGRTRKLWRDWRLAGVIAGKNEGENRTRMQRLEYSSTNMYAIKHRKLLCKSQKVSHP